MIDTARIVNIKKRVDALQELNVVLCWLMRGWIFGLVTEYYGVPLNNFSLLRASIVVIVGSTMTLLLYYRQSLSVFVAGPSLIILVLTFILLSFTTSGDPSHIYNPVVYKVVALAMLIISIAVSSCINLVWKKS